MIRVALPYHLQNLAKTDREVQVKVLGAITVLAVIRSLEARYPMLRGAVLEHGTGKRRPLIRFFACGEDVSTEVDQQLLPEQVCSGKEPLMIVGAIAGG